MSINYCKDVSTEESFVDYIFNDSEKKAVLNEIKNSSFNIADTGIGGIYVSTLKINYEKNNNQYYVFFYVLLSMTSNDNNIYKILDKSVDNTLSEPQYCLYMFNNLSSTATTIMNKLKEN